MKSFPITHYNGYRGEDELVIYNGVGSTETNRYGWEAAVAKGRVVACGGNNNAIPEGGFVVSGHGKAALFLAENLCLGARAEIGDDGKSFFAEIDTEGKKILGRNQINEIHSRMEDLNREDYPYDKANAEKALSDAEIALEKEDFSAVKALTERAYYLTTRSVAGETRGIWHRPHEKSEAEVEATVKRFADAGFNLLLVETNYEGYANALKCAHDYLPVRKGFENGFDVIDAFIRICKKYGIKIHAWFEDFFYGYEGTGCPMAEIHPEWMAKRKDGGLLHDAYDTFYFLNPALDEVREFLLNHCKELLDNYDFDGLQLDYIRYPVIRGIDRAAGFDGKTRELFLKDSGIDIDLIETTKCEEWEKFTDWCAEKVTSYVADIHSLIMEYRANGRDIQLTTAVIGDPVEAIRTKCQDWRYWVKQGWLDAIYPMAYFNDADEVGSEVGYMVENYGEADNISGIAPMFNHLPVIESTKQIEVCRKVGAKGVAFFATHNSTDEQLETLKIGVFRNK